MPLNLTPMTPWSQTVVTAPTAPSTTSKFDIDIMAPLIRERVAEGMIEEPRIQAQLSSARSFFTGDALIKTADLLRDLKFGQVLRVDIEKDQNPLSLFQTREVTYNTIDDCHEQINLDCEVPCINTLPTFEYMLVRFDCEWAYGVRACDKNKDFWDLDFMTRQYAKSRDAKNFGQELALWNKAVRAGITTPATTVDAVIARQHPTHYWADCGAVSANGRDNITMGYWYMKNSFEDINPTVFITDEAAHDIIRSVENPYNLNFSNTRVNTYHDWDMASGFTVSSAVETIFGGDIPVVVMKRSPWLTYVSDGGLVSQYPLYNQAATKQYVAMFDPRYAYMFKKDGYHLNIKPYDCDKLDFGMIDTEYTGSGITFPQFALVQEYDFGFVTTSVGD